MTRLFQAFPAIIGMIHLKGLPGSPRGHLSMKNIVNHAVQEAKIYQHGHIDALLLENMHDRPWQLGKCVGPETTAAMAAVAAHIRREITDIPIGVQILSAANQQALAVAKAADLDFIRAEGFVFSHIGDEGFIDSCAADLIRYRKQIDAQHIKVFTDIKKKHSSHTITSDVSLIETAEAAELFLSDGVIITGTSTGVPTSPQQVEDVKQHVNIPVLVGSGVTKTNVAQYMSADGIIIGSHLKKSGHWDDELDANKVSDFMNYVMQLRSDR